MVLMSRKPFSKVSRETDVVLIVLEEQDVDGIHVRIVAPLRSSSLRSSELRGAHSAMSFKVKVGLPRGAPRRGAECGGRGWI